jgi:hypothetical protein
LNLPQVRRHLQRAAGQDRGKRNSGSNAKREVAEREKSREDEEKEEKEEEEKNNNTTFACRLHSPHLSSSRSAPQSKARALKLSASMIPATSVLVQNTDDGDGDGDGDASDAFESNVLYTGKHASDCTRPSHS